MNKRTCSCKNPRCQEVLKSYFFDEDSPFPDPKKPQLLFKLANPRANPSSRHKLQSARRQQLYDRAAKLLNVSHCGTLIVGIHHFHRDVISAYAKGDSREAIFQDYLLPSSLVSNNRLGVKFTAVDRFCCLGTNAADKGCKKALRKAERARGDDNQPLTKKDFCSCARFLNAPFVTVERAAECIVLPDGRRSSAAV